MTLVTNLKQHSHIITTALCLALILMGILLLQTGQGGAPILFISAFVIGGYQSAKEGLTELIFDKHLSVDLLMILAAIGSGLMRLLDGGPAHLYLLPFFYSGRISHGKEQECHRSFDEHDASNGSQNRGKW